MNEPNANQPNVQSGAEHEEAIHLPRPTMWPAVLALGISLVMAGLLLSLVFSFAGLVVFFLALVGWIGELQNE